MAIDKRGGRAYLSLIATRANLWKGQQMNQITIGYNVKFTNWVSVNNDYNFVDLEDAKDFIKKFEVYGYEAEITAITAQASQMKVGAN